MAELFNLKFVCGNKAIGMNGCLLQQSPEVLGERIVVKSASITVGVGANSECTPDPKMKLDFNQSSHYVCIPLLFGIRIIIKGLGGLVLNILSWEACHMEKDNIHLTGLNQFEHLVMLVPREANGATMPKQKKVHYDFAVNQVNLRGGQKYLH